MGHTVSWRLGAVLFGAMLALSGYATGQAILPIPFATGVNAATSTIPISFAPPIANATHPLTDYQVPYLPIRTYEVGDLNGDGKLDIVICPNYFVNQPQLSFSILLNRGDGKFSDGTAEMIQGVVPTCGSINNIFIRDFNGDGRPDILIIDQGLEDKDVANPGFDGAKNILLASQPNGKLQDVSLTAFLGQANNFNHVSSVGDVNGDGSLDVVLARLGGPRFPSEGVVLLLNDGRGNFTENASRLPHEIRLRPRNFTQLPNVDYQPAGTTGVGDIDGDGKLDIVTATYNYPDTSGKRTVRMLRQSATGDFIEATRVEIPVAIASIPYFSGGTVTNGFNGLGSSRVVIADFNRDGRADVLIVWEGSSVSYFQFLRNDGNWQFTDVTVAWWGGYQSHSLATGNVQVPVQFVEFRDINGDGIPDMVVRRAGGPISSVTTSVQWYLNDGTGKLSPWRWVNGDGSPTDTAAITNALGCGPCDYTTFMLFDVNGDGIDDPVSFNYLTNFPQTPFRGTGIELRTFQSSRQLAQLLSRRGGVDLDGAGRGAVLVRATDSSAIFAGRLSGNTFSWARLNDPGPNFRLLGAADFTGAGRSDLAMLRENPSLLNANGQGITQFWKAFNSANVTNLRDVRPAWDVQAVGDLDGDGFGDLVWRFRGMSPNIDDQGVSYIWFGTGSGVAQVRKRGGAPLTWTLLGAADINGEGAADMVYVSPTGAIRVLMATPQRTCANFSGGNLPAGFVALRFADFTGSQRADILARNANTGEVRLINLDATGVTLPTFTGAPDDPNASCTASTLAARQTTYNLGSVDPAWTYFASNDLNADGRFDIVWRRPDGTFAVWLMGVNGTIQSTITNAGTPPVAGTPFPLQ